MKKTDAPAPGALGRAGFAAPEAILDAVRWLRGRGDAVADVYTPFPVHGMSEALGLAPSRLPVACFLFAMAGLGFAFFLEIWTSAVNYPLNVGGKPMDSFPAFIPVAFELTVLFAGLGVVASFLLVSRMRPRLRVPAQHADVNDHRFVLVFTAAPGHDLGETLEELRRRGAQDAELLEHEPPAVPLWDRRIGWRGVLLAALPTLAVIALFPLFKRNIRQRNTMWDAGMMRTAAFQSFDPNPLLPRGQTLQPPPEGVVPRNYSPFPYGPGSKEADRAGKELANPWPPTLANLERGKLLFNRVCATCHGPLGHGDSPLIASFPKPPDLQSSRIRAFPDGKVFFIATLGRRNMKGQGDLISAEDRWKIILYLRDLQRTHPVSDPPPADTPADTPVAPGLHP